MWYFLIFLFVTGFILFFLFKEGRELTQITVSKAGAISTIEKKLLEQFLDTFCKELYLDDFKFSSMRILPDKLMIYFILNEPKEKDREVFSQNAEVELKDYFKHYFGYSQPVEILFLSNSK